LAEAGWGIRGVPDTTLWVKGGEGRATAFVAVVVLEGGEDGGELDLGVVDAGIVDLVCGGSGWVGGGVDVPVVARVALLLGDGGVGRSEGALFAAREDGGVGVGGGVGGAGHAAVVVVGERNSKGDGILFV
jgi:hypothetical protein